MEWSKSKTDANYALTSFLFFVYCAYSNSRNKTDNSNIVKHNLSPRQPRQFDPLSRTGQNRDYMTHVRSELGSGLNMKVVALDLSFPTHLPAPQSDIRNSCYVLRTERVSNYYLFIN